MLLFSRVSSYMFPLTSAIFKELSTQKIFILK